MISTNNTDRTTSTFCILALFFGTVSSAAAAAAAESQLRGSSHQSSMGNHQRRRSLVPAHAGVGCPVLVRVATFTSDLPTSIYFNEGRSDGFVGAGTPNQLNDNDDWNIQWILNTFPCPNTDHANPDEECTMLSTVHDESRLDMPNGRVGSAQPNTEVLLSQFWKVTRDGGNNRITLSNAANGRVIIPHNSGNGDALRYGNPGYNDNDRFWNIDETWFCLV